ncbi:MAG: phenylalanine--tRNA ligase subunit alpha [Candidatus Gottesmanbacteria bacterium]|nr:phenylalanine--tRNA ligase subunit alpha [Candidatus Gottesmanbacteria bacterium]
MTNLIYMTDSYRTELAAQVVSCIKKGSGWEIVLDQTIFYPQGGGQPSDKGTIKGKQGLATVKHVRMLGDEVIHECALNGTIDEKESVECSIDWNARYHNMRAHSAGHVVHEAVRLVAPYLDPIKGEHGKSAYIEYKGSLPVDKKPLIEQQGNDLIRQNLTLKTEFVTLDELQKRASYIPEHLPKHKPLRILSVGNYPPIPDGGTQVKSTGEIGEITITSVDNADDHVRVYYAIPPNESDETKNDTCQSVDSTVSTSRHDTGNQAIKVDQIMTAPQFIGLLLDAQRNAKEFITISDKSAEELRLLLLGPKSELGRLTKQIRQVPASDRGNVGVVVNEVKSSIIEAIAIHAAHSTTSKPGFDLNWADVTIPGIRPPEGHLHIVSQAITEITRIFERIGFTRVRHPEVDWDYYAFEALNMPPHHPARDEWETFFIDYPGKPPGTRPGLEATRRKQIVLTPHTSNGQVREMEKGKLPIRMINIAKCYRRQSDVSHVPMFHQFEGMYIDKGVTIGDLTGVFNFFVKNYFGPDRNVRLRPFHFQFTEPSVEIDINCGICLGKGCRLCKEGWLEMAGGGMVHPNVLKAGGVDPSVYSGFAFGWGVERAAMMKSGTKLDDIRLLYSNDIRFLNQF